MQRILALIAISVTAAAATSPALGFERSFWVWQRSSPLSEQELAVLKQNGITRIFWHIGELVNTGDDWQWKSRFPLPPSSEIRFDPVVRLVSNERSPFNERSLERLRKVAVGSRQSDIQFDYDCPDRLLSDYAAALKSVGQSTGRVTITGLPHWTRSGALQNFRGCIEAVFPMFYDFQPEPVLPNDGPRPLLDPAKMNEMLREWASCPIPWHAGLPNFSRLTAYDAKGKSHGHIRNWNWDEITWQRALVSEDAGSAGVFILRALTAVRISKTELGKDDRLVVRMMRPELLAQASAAAEQAGAGGVVFFRLPEDSLAANGCSLPQLLHLQAKPKLVVTKGASGSSLQITNQGEGDLEPNLSTDRPVRGYHLEISSDLPLFREAEPGEFAPEIVASDKPDGRKVPLPFARVVSFEFSSLAAGETLQTGLIQLAPGASFRQTRYRIQPIEPEWKLLE